MHTQTRKFVDEAREALLPLLRALLETNRFTEAKDVVDLMAALARVGDNTPREIPGPESLKPEAPLAESFRALMPMGGYMDQKIDQNLAARLPSIDEIDAANDAATKKEDEEFIACTAADADYP